MMSRFVSRFGGLQLDILRKQLACNAGTGGGTRTRTGIAPQRILSPLRLPFRHTGVRLQMEARLAREAP